MGLVHFEKPIKIMLNRQLLFAPLMSIENFVKLWHVVSFPSLFRRFRPKVICTSHVQGRRKREEEGQRGNWPLPYSMVCSIGNQNLLIQKVLNYYLLPPRFLDFPTALRYACPGGHEATPGSEKQKSICFT